MKNTELVFILDRSGSMSGLEQSTISGFNEMIFKQKKQEGKVYVTTMLFDDEFEILHNRVPLEKVKKMTEKQYYVRGCTALLDAIGMSIQRMKPYQNHHTIFVIITDGYENASQEYSYAQVKKMITRQKIENNWEFLFLGANIDAQKEGKKFGIDENRSVSYVNDRQGIQKNYETVGKAISNFRCSQIQDDWKKDIEEDYKKRKSA